MFRRFWLGEGATSDDGFSVKLTGRNKIDYREGDKILIAYRERLIGDPSMDIDSSSIESWQPPYQNEVITPERRQQILNNICSAMDFLGLTYVIR